MKIYRVQYCDGGTRSVWLNYRSAVGSGAQAHAETEVQVTHVPETAWKPANSVAEQRLRRVEELWATLSHTDQESLDILLEQLLARQKRQATVVRTPPWRDEAAAMLELDRLVDAS